MGMHRSGDPTLSGPSAMLTIDRVGGHEADIRPNTLPAFYRRLQVDIFRLLLGFLRRKCKIEKCVNSEYNQGKQDVKR